jgi:putative phosphoesterase
MRDSKQLVILSDTHLKSCQPLPPTLEAAIDNADLVVHAGDFVSPEFYDSLLHRKPLLCALGNSDDRSLASRIPELGEREILGCRIGVMHGWGSPRDLVQRIAQRINPERYHLFVYGHSHFPDITTHGNTLFVNPGSATERRFAPHCSFVEIKISRTGMSPPVIINL